jgi:hypothetical protein
MKSYVDSVYCEFKYSGVGAVLLASAAIATLAVVAATPFTPGLRAAFAALVVGLACRARRSMTRVRAMRLDPAGTMEVWSLDGALASGSVRDGSFVSPWLTLVRWRPRGARIDRTVLILPDMAKPEDFRRLRVALRWA